MVFKKRLTPACKKIEIGLFFKQFEDYCKNTNIAEDQDSVAVAYADFGKVFWSKQKP